MTDKEYITLLADSLKKKSYLLDLLLAKNEEQRVYLLDENMTTEDFERLVSEKEDIIAEITKLDDGFETVFERMKAIMERDKALYADEIKKMQEYIRRIMQKDSQIRASEQRNHELAKQKFSNVRTRIREAKASQKMVNTYYQNMMRQATIDPSYYDGKQ